MKKLKMAMIHPAVGSSLGGSQVFVLELAEKLREHLEVSILAGQKVNELCIPIAGIPRGALCKTPNPLLKLLLKLLGCFTTIPEIHLESLTFALPLFLHLLFNRYDILYPNNSTFGLLLCNLIRTIKGTPILFTEHESHFKKSIHRNANLRPDAYVILNQEDFEFVTTHYSDLNTVLIQNGVNLSRFQMPSFQELNQYGKIVLTVGRNSSVKRLDLVIKAVARLENVKLLMLATGENLEQLESLGNTLMGKERFHFFSSVEHAEIAQYYQKCDVFTLPSSSEPFGLVYIEAMACNKPVVAPDDPPRRSIVGNAGILCDVENIEEYAAALNKALNTDYNNIPLEQARNFSLDCTAEKYRSVIESLSGKH